MQTIYTHKFYENYNFYERMVYNNRNVVNKESSNKALGLIEV